MSSVSTFVTANSQSSVSTFVTANSQSSVSTFVTANSQSSASTFQDRKGKFKEYYQKAKGWMTTTEIKRMSNTVTSIYGASFKLKSGKPIQVISGLLDLTSALAEFGKKYGPAVGAGAALVNSILGCVGANGPSLPSIIGGMLQKQTDQIAGMMDQQTQEIAHMFRNHSDLMSTNFKQISTQIRCVQKKETEFSG